MVPLILEVGLEGLMNQKESRNLLPRDRKARAAAPHLGARAVLEEMSRG